MPRPTQRLDGVVRNIRQPVAFTSEEYGQLKRQAYECNLTLTELIRFRSLRCRISKPTAYPKIDDQLHKDLNSLGISLNQIAKRVNLAISIDSNPSLHSCQLNQLLAHLSSILESIQSQLATVERKTLAIESRRLSAFNTPLDRKLSVRLAPDEYESLKQKASSARISIAQLLRRAALRLSIAEPPPPPLSYWKIHAELSRITNNLRQLLRAVNITQMEIEFPHETVFQALGKIQSVGLQLLGVPDEEAQFA